MNRKHAAVVALVALIMLAGCADATATTTVDSDGEIEQIQMEVEMSQQAYATALEGVGEEGHDSVSGAIASDIETENDDEVGDVEYEDYRDGDQYVSQVTINEVHVDEMEGVETEMTEDDTVVYTDSAIIDADTNDVDKFTYQVEMPGEITDTNADEVDEENNMAIWQLNGESETLYVESEQGSFSLWTVATAVGIGAVVLIGGLLAYRRLGEDNATSETQR
jgi:hypothetical protein